MKRQFLTLFLLIGLIAIGSAHANDGGIYAVQPFGAKYENKMKSFTFTGQYAIEFKKLLPPAFSVLTSMQPELKNPYEKNFRGLALQDANGNALEIFCKSADETHQNGKATIKEATETTCTFTVMDKADAEFSPTNKVQVKDALQKAQSANQIK